jgi:hypothetical protein
MRATRTINETCHKHDGMYHRCEIKINETPEKNYKEFHLKYKGERGQNSIYIRLNTDECKILAMRLYRDINKAVKIDEERVKNSILKPYHSPADYENDEVINRDENVEFPNELIFQSKMNYEKYDL